MAARTVQRLFARGIRISRVVISDAHRFLFLHVQKTGGSTIDNRFDEVLPDARSLPGMNKHAALGAILEQESALASYWTVGFVRNPFARLVSWWRMVKRLEEYAAAGEEKAARFLQRPGFMRSVSRSYPDFESFVMRGTEEHRRLRTPQLKYVVSRTRHADFIGRQESLELDLRAVFARLELPWAPLESVNIDHHRPDYRELYTAAMRARAEEIFAPDLAAFDYSF